MPKRIIAAAAVFMFICAQAVPGQPAKQDAVFANVKMVVNDNGKFRQKSVRLTFQDDQLLIKGKKGTTKSLLYKSMKSAEYSYTKNPRWKTGIGLSAAAILVPPLWLISIPIGFTKHRRHWLTIRTDDDFAVLKLSKRNRKHLIPTFEMRSGVIVQALGDDK